MTVKLKNIIDAVLTVTDIIALRQSQSQNTIAILALPLGNTDHDIQYDNAKGCLPRSSLTTFYKQTRSLLLVFRTAEVGPNGTFATNRWYREPTHH